MERKIGNIFGFSGGNYAGNVYDKCHLSPTLSTMQWGCKQPMIVEANSIRMVRTEEGKALRKQYEKPNQLGFMDNGTGQHQSNTVYDEKALCPNITTVNGGGTQQIKVATQYRIRKLTPKECWRLMDFSDEDFEKAEKVNSNTQLYKQAGNSIVVNVLAAILGQLLQGKEDLYKEII